MTEPSEKYLLERLVLASSALSLPSPQDLRATLTRNAKAPKWKLRPLSAIKGMAWHQELAWGTVESVAVYHTGKDSHIRNGGVESIAYTWAIRRSGQIVLCNDLKKVPWSQGHAEYAGDANKDFMSVMFEGLFAGDHVTDPTAGQPNDLQMLAGLGLWQICKSEFGWNEGDIWGHFLLGKPSCPGATLQSIVQAMRANALLRKYDFRKVEGRQQALKDLGFYKATVDGEWGPGSKAALTNFQKAAALVTDGVWGAQTAEAIVAALRAKRLA